MRLRPRGTEIAFSSIMLLFAFELCASNNDTWTMARERKARIVKKLRKDFRKLKKQEGALKLIGGENGDHEGAIICLVLTFTREEDLIIKILFAHVK